MLQRRNYSASEYGSTNTHFAPKKNKKKKNAVKTRQYGNNQSPNSKLSSTSTNLIPSTRTDRSDQFTRPSNKHPLRKKAMRKEIK